MIKNILIIIKFDETDKILLYLIINTTSKLMNNFSVMEHCL